jgi:homoserine kinase
MTAIRVRVPASTSNLGGGFDCIGIAVDRWLRVDASLTGEDTEVVRVARGGTLSALESAPKEDLIYRGFAAACEAVERHLPGGVAFDVDSDIPVGRGLGSSAAALLAGAAAANALLGLGLADVALAQLCAEIEGHGDNVGPCLTGGAVFATLDAAEGLLLSPITVHPSIHLVFAIPEFRVDTHQARAALPASISFDDARAAAAAGAALVLGLESGDHALLAAGMAGPLHIPYRRPLVRGYDQVVNAARGAGAIGATLSGSGSAIVALAVPQRVRAVADAMTGAWGASGVAAESLVSPPLPGGLRIERIPMSNDAVGGKPAEQSDAEHISSNTR